MTRSVRIRPARADEAGFLSGLALRSKAYWGYDAEFLERCREELTLDAAELGRRRTVVAERAGRVVGFANFHGEPPEGELGMLFVEPEVIGQGVGRALFAHTVEAARSLGFARVVLDADPNAEPFYEAMGAVPVGRVPSGSIPGRSLTRYGYTITG